MRTGYASGICAEHLHGQDGRDLRRIFYLFREKLTFSNAGVR